MLSSSLSSKTANEFFDFSLEELREYYGIDDEFIKASNELGKIIEKKIFPIMKGFYDFHEKHPKLLGYFKSESIRQSVKAKSSIALLKFFRTNYDEEFVIENSIIGIVHFNIGLPSFYYSAIMAHIKEVIFKEIEPELTELQKIEAKSIISKAVNISKFITINAYNFLVQSNNLLMKRDVRRLLRATCHDLSNQIAIIDTSTKWLEKDTSRLEKEIPRLSKSIGRMIETISEARTSTNYTGDLSDEIDDNIGVQDLLYNLSETIQENLIEKKSYFKIGSEIDPDAKISCNYNVLLNQILTGIILEIIDQVPIKSKILAEVDLVDGDPTVKILSNGIESLSQRRVKLPVIIAEYYAKLFNIEIEFAPNKTSKQIKIGATEDTYYLLLSFKFKKQVN